MGFPLADQQRRKAQPPANRITAIINRTNILFFMNDLSSFTLFLSIQLISSRIVHSLSNPCMHHAVFACVHTIYETSMLNSYFYTTILDYNELVLVFQPAIFHNVQTVKMVSNIFFSILRCKLCEFSKNFLRQGKRK